MFMTSFKSLIIMSNRQIEPIVLTLQRHESSANFHDVKYYSRYYLWLALSGMLSSVQPAKLTSYDDDTKTLLVVRNSEDIIILHEDLKERYN